MDVRGSLQAALIAVLATAVTAVILVAEERWLVLGAAFSAVALAVGIERSGGTRRFAVFLGKPGLGPALLIPAAGLAIALILREEHFPLLMLATVLVYALACLGLTIQFGFAGTINFAGAAFFGIGGYTAALLGETGLPSLLVLAAGGLCAAGIGCVLILPVLRTRGHYAALITIAFGLLFRSFLEVNQTLGGPQGLKVEGARIAGWSLFDTIQIGAFETSYYFNYVFLALALFSLFLLLTRRLEKSWVGLNLDAVREDPVAASVFGIHVAYWRIASFVLGNFLIGIAGATYAMMQNFIAPSNFTFSDSLLMLSIVILGGVGNVWGILPAAILVMVIPEKLQEIGEYRVLVFAIVVVLVLRFRPAGLFPRAMRSFKGEVRS